MIRAVLFDLDGTILDSTEAIMRSYHHLFDTLGEARPTREVIMRGIGSPLEVEVRRMTSRDPAECARIYRDFFETVAEEHTILLPGARECLESLQSAGLMLGFATSRKRESAERLLAFLGILDFFSCRIGPHDVTHPKPHPESVLKALDTFGAAAEELIFVGDMHYDIEAGHAAGARTIAVTTGYESRRELEALGPERVFDDLGSVRTWILAQCL
jgi:HAD superfamily hydrolase (TIGR01509 family)